MSRNLFSLMAGAALLLPLGGAQADAAGDASPAITPQVRKIQRDMITLDTHLDTPASLDLPGWSILASMTSSRTTPRLTFRV